MDFVHPQKKFHGFCCCGNDANLSTTYWLMNIFKCRERERERINQPIYPNTWLMNIFHIRMWRESITMKIFVGNGGTFS